MVFRLVKHIAPLVLFFVFTKGISQDISTAGYNNFRETVWLTSERQLYIAGEIISFHARILEQDTYLSSVLSRNLKVELLGPDGYAISQQNLVLDESSVSGKFLLPDDTDTGWYYIRAYTKWMRNFDHSVFGLVAIKVFNLGDTKNISSFMIPGEIKSILYPQGKSTGFFLGYDKFNGIKAQGLLIDNLGDTVSEFSTHESGWAIISERIDSDDNYRISLNGIPSQEYIPQSEIVNPGILEIEILESRRSLNLRVSGNQGAETGNIRILAHQSYSRYWGSEETDNYEALFTIPKNSLPQGIVQFTVFDDANNILAKRLWSMHNSLSIDVRMTGGTDSLELRHEYTAELSLPVETADLAIQISKKETGLMLNEYIPGLPGWNCSSIIPNDFDAFQGWLLGNSYPDEVLLSAVNSEDFYPIAEHIKHLPETRAGVIEGRVINKETGFGVGEIGVSITILNNNRFDATTTDPNGYFYYSLDGLEGATDYILNFTTSSDPDLEIIVNQEFAPQLTGIRGKFYLTEEELEFSNQLNTNIQINNIYGLIKEFSEPIAREMMIRQTFFHPPDHVTVLDDFIKLANVREVIYELVPNVGVRSQNGRDAVHVNSDNQFLDNLETLVLLDGIPLANQTKLLHLSPDRIERIEVKSKMYVHGKNIYSAIVNFVSPNKDYAGLDLPGNSILATYDLPVNGLKVSPLINEQAVNIPNLETTLLLDYVRCKASHKVEFMSNDLNGPFQIKVYGFDQFGNWISGVRDLTIGR